MKGGNFGHLCVAIETDAAFLSLFKSDFIKRWMKDERMCWAGSNGRKQRANSLTCVRTMAVAAHAILSRVSAGVSVCYVPVGTFNTADSLASARYLNSSAVLVTATVVLMEDDLRYR